MKCWLLWASLVVLVNGSLSAKIGYQDDAYAYGECPIAQYATKIGCFKDPGNTGTRLLDEELVNIRDESNPNYGGFLIDWNNWKDSVNKLFCACATKARENGYQYFGLQYYGECWSGTDSQSYGDAGESDNCIQEYDTSCNVNNTEHACVGKEWTNYVYSVELPA